MINQPPTPDIFRHMSVEMLYLYTANRPCRLIQRDGQPYLERYYVMSSTGATDSEEGEQIIYLHRFVGSGEDQALHDHPWQCESLLLHGWYDERILIDNQTVQQHTRTPGTLRKINPYQPHQIVNPRPETWTLFLTHERERSWHFYIPAPDSHSYVMIGYRDYLNSHDPKSSGKVSRHDWWLDPDCPTGATAGREPLSELFA